MKKTTLLVSVGIICLAAAFVGGSWVAQYQFGGKLDNVQTNQATNKAYENTK